MDEIEKQERLRQTINIRFEPFVPCTSQDCLNEATVGSISYDPGERHWMLVAICKDCTRKMAQNYGLEGEG